MRWLIPILLLGCAGEDAPGRSFIRQGRDPDAAPQPPDAVVADAGSTDGPAVDGAPTPRGPARRLWVLTHGDEWAAGVRARLDPPHAPPEGAPGALSALPEAIPVVVWGGPDSAGAGLLSTLTPPVGVFHDLARRPDSAEADAGWLVAHHLETQRALRVEGRPVLLTTFADREAWAALRRRLEVLPIEPWLVAVVDPRARAVVPAGAVAVTPRGAYGQARPPDAANLARWRRATLAEGARWLPLAAAPANPRLDDPDAVVEAPLGGRRLATSLARARRACDPQWPTILVDGAGAWRHDRQLDPVVGQTTDLPSELTTGVEYRAYGDARLRAVRGALLAAAGRPPTDLAAAPPLLELARAAGVLVERLEADAGGVHLELVDESGGQGVFEALLDGRPFVVPAEATLRYTRSAAEVFVDLGFDRADRLHDVLPRPEGSQVRVPLGAFAGRRVEEVVLVYGGGALRVAATITDARLTAP